MLAPRIPVQQEDLAPQCIILYDPDIPWINCMCVILSTWIVEGIECCSTAAATDQESQHLIIPSNWGNSYSSFGWSDGHACTDKVYGNSTLILSKSFCTKYITHSAKQSLEKELICAKVLVFVVIHMNKVGFVVESTFLHCLYLSNDMILWLSSNEFILVPPQCA